MKNRRHSSILCLVLAAAAPGCGDRAEHAFALVAEGPLYYVAPNGSDRGNGSAEAPWASIATALARVPDGSTVLVRPGTYAGRVRLVGSFAHGVTVRSEIPYRAILRNDAQVVYATSASGITFEGFDIAHAGPGARSPVIQLDGQGTGAVNRITLRDNVIHDSHWNDLAKINNGVNAIRVQGNVFYNQSGPDEHIDINSVEDVVVEDNLFFNDFAGSGRTNGNDTASFIVVKDSNDAEDRFVGSRNVQVRRNVFMGWQGSRGAGFFLCGEDGKPYFEAYDVLVENNLMLGDSPVPMRAPLSVKGCRDVTFRNNTLTGDTPGAAFALRIVREGANQPAQNIHLHANVFADPTGTMGSFSDVEPGQVGHFLLAHNLFWNGGAPVPHGAPTAVNVEADGARVEGDPALPDPGPAVRPRWRPERGLFADGSTTIAEARARLVQTYGTPGPGSTAEGRGDPATAAAEDAQGLPRGIAPDVGAVETP